ncbi:MAG: Gfo/Idh/MocA family oxidoreductase [Chloroflexota bacterium]|nr:Gfo/Idh/MocA family oxidoreductase [Chloroflexota bacterium]
MSKHRLGIIGCGWIAPFHVGALNRLSDRAEVIWTADPDRERAAHIASTLEGAGSIDVLGDYRDGLERVDAAIILTPHHLHHPITMDALRAGCHVLLEKPFALTLEEADDMIAEADRQGKTLMIALPHRYRVSTQAFKGAIDSGDYGRLFMLDAFMDEDNREYITGGWFVKKATLGGGVFFSASAHMLDVMLWIAGDAQSVSMAGAHAGIPMEGEDTAISIIKFKNGVVGTTRHTWFSPAPAHWYVMRAYCERAVITLTVNPLGKLAVEGFSCPWQSRITVSQSGCEEKVLLDSGEGLDLTEEVRHFFDCVDSGARPQTDGQVARALMKVVLDAYQESEIKGAN